MSDKIAADKAKKSVKTSVKPKTSKRSSTPAQTAAQGRDEPLPIGGEGRDVAATLSREGRGSLGAEGRQPRCGGGGLACDAALRTREGHAQTAFAKAHATTPMSPTPAKVVPSMSSANAHAWASA